MVRVLVLVGELCVQFLGELLVRMGLNAECCSHGEHLEEVGERRLQVDISLSEHLKVLLSEVPACILLKQLLNRDLLTVFLLQEIGVVKDFLLLNIIFVNQNLGRSVDVIAHPVLREWLALNLIIRHICLLNGADERVRSNFTPGVVLGLAVKFKHFKFRFNKEFLVGRF